MSRPRPGVPDPPGAGWRERVVEEAAALTRAEGWRAVTMGRIAGLVGVSRQSVHAAFGSKRALAEAVVLRELVVFLSEVEAAFERHPDNLVEAIRAATLAVLELALVNPLLAAVLSADQGAGSDLLPVLTTRSTPLLDTARSVVTSRVAGYPGGLTAQEAEVVTDLVVRVVLSHVMRPTDDPATTADRLAWVVGRVTRTVA